MIHGSMEIEIMLTEGTCGGRREKVPIKDESLRTPAPTLSYGILVFPTYGTFPCEAPEEKNDN